MKSRPFESVRKQKGLSLGSGRLLGTAHRAKTLLELVDATLGINKGTLTSEEGVRIGREAHRDAESFEHVGRTALRGGVVYKSETRMTDEQR